MATNIQIFYEKCNHNSMSTYPFFINKLETIEKIVPRQKIEKNNENSNRFKQSLIKNILNQKKCRDCGHTKMFKLGNIIWTDNIKHLIESHQSYPSEYFIKVILNTVVMDGKIINPPIQLNYKQTNHFTYLPLHYNKLLIIDALMHQGSFPRYENEKNKNYLYSEHSGIISVNNGIIDNIIVSAETDRTDIGDDNIFLPKNTPYMAKYEYLFHTHPNTMTYAGRINEGIIYEFPSANDLYNFIKYHNEGKVQASLIVAPEGIYVIRPIFYQDKINIKMELFHYLKKYILKLEKHAMNANKKNLDKLTDPDIFHREISHNFKYINMYNKLIEPSNLFVEFYPREKKKNGEWGLRTISLPYIAN